MAIDSTRFHFNWKKVKGNFTKPESFCPRCTNKVSYFLVWDGSEAGLLGILTYKYAKFYAYKCPICPNFEEVSVEVAKAIMRG
jgi:hypothetical protein